MTLLKYLYCVCRLTFFQLLFMYLGIMYLYELKIVISHGGAGLCRRLKCLNIPNKGLRSEKGLIFQ